MKVFLFYFSIFIIIGCKNNRTPLFAKDANYENEKNNTLFVFVGEQLECKELPYDTGSMDAGFKAKFKIQQVVYGKYDYDTIEFEAYDHYGLPGFSHYKNSLLFLSKYKDKYYQEKYQFHDVYRTKNGRWAGTYWCSDSIYHYDIKPEMIEFEDSVYFPAMHKDMYGDDEDFPCGVPYYKLVGNKQIPIYGNYIEDIFKLKKEGVLTARGLFGDKKESNELISEEVPMAEVKKIVLSKDEAKYQKCTKEFLNSVNMGNFKEFKKWIADTINISDSILLATDLNNKIFQNIFRDKMLKKYNGKLDFDYLWTTIDSTKNSILNLKKKIYESEKDGNRVLIMGYNFYNKRSKKIALKFIKSNDGYKFCGYNSIDFPIYTEPDVQYIVR